MAGTKTHKAIQLVGAYNADVTKSTVLTERETPSPGDDQVVVNILCRPINPSDILIYSGHYAPFQPTKLPVTIGQEGMGIISEVICAFAKYHFSPPFSFPRH
jgi:trans-2-enoyl-CoA reductase